MRTYTKILLGTLAAGVVLTGVLVGRSEAHGWGGPGRGHGPAMMMGQARMLFDQADADRNGTLTRAELDAYAAQSLQRHDADGNSQLEQAEFQGLWAELTRPFQVRAFQFVDADGDGRLTAAEMQQPLGMVMDRLDRNDDGSIAQDELSRGRAGRERGRDRD